MRRSIILRLAVVLLLVAGGLAMPLLASSDHPVVIAKGNGKGDGNGNNDNGNGNNGNGNNGNHGNGNNSGNNGKAKGKDTPQGNQGNDNDGNNGKEQSNGKAKGNEKKRQQAEQLTATTPYTVKVACAAVADGAQTTCTFTGIAPEGAKQVGHVDLAASDVCAEVVGGDYEYVDPDPNTRVTGYQSKGSEGSFMLVLDGQVTPAGQITYWIKAGGDVFPAPGPGLSCAAAAATAPPEPTAAPSPTAAPTTGEVVVVAYACPERPADPAAFDWFGACAPGGTPREFTLAPVSSPDRTVTAATSGAGEARFGDLAPGTYELRPVGDSWCKAKADRVTAKGNVVVEAGQTTSVFAFFCPGKPLK